eukprot:TRINITY_DN17395_c0_g1_i1.p1 TRINITY_DN17395_c0_g1~~TRINITY_DN17395_c0_g1_i1.p1  ORF type:complete len:109 (+),score=2.60 TRINITY_DN17395_c0_g1_i1:54-380(+)
MMHTALSLCFKQDTKKEKPLGVWIVTHLQLPYQKGSSVLLSPEMRMKHVRVFGLLACIYSQMSPYIKSNTPWYEGQDIISAETLVINEWSNMDQYMYGQPQISLSKVG